MMYAYAAEIQPTAQRTAAQRTSKRSKKPQKIKQQHSLICSTPPT